MFGFLLADGPEPLLGVPEGQDAGGAEADPSADALDETGFRGVSEGHCGAARAGA